MADGRRPLRLEAGDAYPHGPAILKGDVLPVPTAPFGKDQIACDSGCAGVRFAQVPDTPEAVAKVILSTPHRKPRDWDYIGNRACWKNMHVDDTVAAVIREYLARQKEAPESLDLNQKAMVATVALINASRVSTNVGPGELDKAVEGLAD